MRQVLFTGAALLMTVSSAAFAATAPANSRAPAAMGSTPAPVTQPADHSASSMPPAGTSTKQTAVVTTSDSSMFANVAAGETLSSKVIGLNVYNNSNEDIGKIKDIAFDAKGVKAYIVAVGGFLGMGDHYVAVNPSAININFDANAKKWHAAMNTNADQLKAAPEYKYSSNQ
jgi:sporulation protein YlmC with PRC-barrel domain